MVSTIITFILASSMVMKLLYKIIPEPEYPLMSALGITIVVENLFSYLIAKKLVKMLNTSAATPSV
jgi:branched-subunit amino acid ABC-type transport system permease component